MKMKMKKKMKNKTAPRRSEEGGLTSVWLRGWEPPREIHPNPNPNPNPNPSLSDPPNETPIPIHWGPFFLPGNKPQWRVVVLGLSCRASAFLNPFLLRLAMRIHPSIR